MLNDPATPSGMRYSGPGWHEWAFGILVAFLAAIEVSFLSQANRAQSGDSYYFKIPGILAIHQTALAILGLLLLSIIVWIAFPKAAQVSNWVVALLSSSGFLLVWIELAVANAVNDTRFLLSDLPYRPINSFGIIGSTVFGAYLLARLPQGLLKPIPSNLIKASLVYGLYVIQAIVFAAAPRMI